MLNDLVLSLWNREHNAENLLKLAESSAVDRILLYAHQEYNYVNSGSGQIDFISLAEYSKKNNIPFIITTCRCDNQPLPYNAAEYKNIEISYWDSYWFIDTYLNQDNIRRDTKEEAPAQFKYPFVSMNNRSHLHRCAMMDLLAKYDLFDVGAVSWRDEYVAWQYVNDTDPMLVHAGGARAYPFKYWTPKRQFLTERDRSDPRTCSPHSLPYEYTESFMQLVVETSVDTIIFSEKTCVPLFVKKPFLVLGAPGHHAALNDRGFVNYDEIFDYSFDSELDTVQRANMIALNLRKISGKTPEELRHLYDLLLPKLIYNYNQAVKYVLDTRNIPDIIKEGYSDPKNEYCSRMLLDFITIYDNKI